MEVAGGKFALTSLLRKAEERSIEAVWKRMVLEPIFEADLPSEQYTYRPGRNAQQAVVEVEEPVFRGYREIVDADLADYFGSIPHADLLKSVARRIVDRRVLHLIKMWHECPVEETGDRGGRSGRLVAWLSAPPPGEVKFRPVEIQL